MENQPKENQELETQNKQKNEQVELIKQQIESGISEDDALEVAFRAAQEADKFAQKNPKTPELPQEELLEQTDNEVQLTDGYQVVQAEQGLELDIHSMLKEAQNGAEWEDPFENEEEAPSVKKYIIYVAKDFIPKLDTLDSDERNAYINDSLRLKSDSDSGAKRLESFKKLLKHGFVALLTVIIGTPVMFYIINRSIDMTLSNYSYVQKNFENLYRQRAEKDRVIQRAGSIHN